MPLAIEQGVAPCEQFPKRNERKHQMIPDRLREVFSDMTVVVDRDFLSSREIDDELAEAVVQQKDRADTKPQVIIYTRESEEDLHTTFISDNVECLLGHEPSDFLKEPSFWMDLIHPDDQEEVLERLSLVHDLGYSVNEYRLAHKDGTYRWVRDERTLIPANGDSSGEILGSLTDITQFKRIEAALDHSESRYSSLVDSAPMGMISFNGRGEIADVNQAALRILGTPLSKVSDPRDLLSLVPIVEAGIMEAVLECLSAGTSGVGELQYKSKANRDVYVKVHVVPILGPQDTVSGAYAFLHDISDQKRAEELVIRSERLKVMGQIANGVGHDFSNLLQIVSGNANVALTNLDLMDYDSVQQNIGEILRGAKSVTPAVRWLQKFGMGDPPGATSEKEVFDLSQVVMEAVDLCKLWSKAELQRTKVDISYKVQLQKQCFVTGVPDQMTWVTLNLLKNSVEAMPQGGTIAVRTCIDSDRVILTVKDEGLGLPVQELRNITKPFWSTKEGHAGMGLSFNAEILRRYGGSLGVRRAKRRGTIFKVKLAYVSDPTIERIALAKEAVANKGYSVLFIDDEEHVVTMFEQGLRLLGHSLTPAYSGREGIERFKKSRFDAVICGLAMEEMNGWEIAEGIDRICRDLDISKPPIIILTGCSGVTNAVEMQTHPAVDRLLHKPVEFSELLEAVTDEINNSLEHAAFSGRVDRVDLLDYMQMLFLNGKKVVLEIKSRNGTKGLVFVAKGRILHSVCQDGSKGEEALFKCLTFKGGSFTSHPWSEPQKITIERGVEALLLEAARLRDEEMEDNGNSARES